PAMPLEFEVESCYCRFDICILPRIGREASANRLAEASRTSFPIYYATLMFERRSAHGHEQVLFASLPSRMEKTVPTGLGRICAWPRSLGPIRQLSTDALTREPSPRVSMQPEWSTLPFPLSVIPVEQLLKK